MVKALLTSAALVLASVLVSGTPMQAQAINASRIIDMHVNVESENRAFSGSVMEGGKGFLIRLARVGTFEIMPVQISEGRYAVVVKGGPEGAEPEDLRQVETLTAREGVPVALRSMPRVGLVIEGSRIPEVTAVVRPAAYTFLSAPRAFQDRCCVTCGNVTACACKVVAECGNCCVNPCCPPPDITMDDRFFPRVARFTARTCGNEIRNEERLFTPASEPARIAAGLYRRKAPGTVRSALSARAPAYNP